MDPDDYDYGNNDLLDEDFDVDEDDYDYFDDVLEDEY